MAGKDNLMGNIFCLHYFHDSWESANPTVFEGILPPTDGSKSFFGAGFFTNMYLGYK